MCVGFSRRSPHAGPTIPATSVIILISPNLRFLTFHRVTECSTNSAVFTSNTGWFIINTPGSLGAASFLCMFFLFSFFSSMCFDLSQWKSSGLWWSVFRMPLSPTVPPQCGRETRSWNGSGSFHCPHICFSDGRLPGDGVRRGTPRLKLHDVSKRPTQAAHPKPPRKSVGITRKHQRVHLCPRKKRRPRFHFN